MRFCYEPTPKLSDERPARSRRRRGRAVVASLFAVAACLAVTACGSAESPTILNTEKIERAIEHSSWAQRGRRAHVSCPSGVHQQKGLVFFCTATVGSTSTGFVVTELDGAGRVHYQAR
jgi:hypothetical protein